MDCGCHGQPMYWNKDRRYLAGGFWRCAVKKSVYGRDRYDRDPIFRISKNLHDHARRRADTLKRRRESLGPLPQ